MQTLDVALGERSYPIFIGSGLLTEAGTLLASRLDAPRVVIASNPVIAPRWLTPLRESLSSAGVTSDVILEKGHGVEQLETDVGELIGNFTKERLGIASPQSGQQDQGSKVRTQVEEVCRRKLAGHHGMAGARFPSGVEQLSKLANAQPMHLVGSGARCFSGFALEGRDGDPLHS